jgi:hypothetical protein
VEVICVDASAWHKWLLPESQRAGRPQPDGSWRSASFYDIDSWSTRRVLLSFLPPPLVNPDDRLLVSIDDEAINVSGPILTVAVDAYHGQPLRMDTLRVTLAMDEQGNLAVAAANLTHVPLIVPLASLLLGLAPAPDWIPDTTPDIRWTPDALSQEVW